MFDDMLVKGLAKADHNNHLREILKVLRYHKMMLNPAKSPLLGLDIFGAHDLKKMNQGQS